MHPSRALTQWSGERCIMFCQHMRWVPSICVMGPTAVLISLPSSPYTALETSTVNRPTEEKEREWCVLPLQNLHMVVCMFTISICVFLTCLLYTCQIVFISVLQRKNDANDALSSPFEFTSIILKHPDCHIVTEFTCLQFDFFPLYPSILLVVSLEGHYSYCHLLV